MSGGGVFAKGRRTPVSTEFGLMNDLEIARRRNVHEEQKELNALVDRCLNRKDFVQPMLHGPDRQVTLPHYYLPFTSDHLLKIKGNDHLHEVHDPLTGEHSVKPSFPDYSETEIAAPIGSNAKRQKELREQSKNHSEVEALLSSNNAEESAKEYAWRTRLKPKKWSTLNEIHHLVYSDASNSTASPLDQVYVNGNTDLFLLSRDIIILFKVQVRSS